MKKPRYQDYVIKDGKLVGEFEEMYRDHDEPWDQVILGRVSPSKRVGLDLLDRVKAATGARRVIELGCGLGDYAHRIAERGFDVLGLDISPTAIAKAQQTYPGVTFRTGTVKDIAVIRDVAPDIIVMAEITWYILDDLRWFLDRLRADLPDVVILHLLATYPPGVQKFGTEYFTDLSGILSYFGMYYAESGSLDYEKGISTFFLGAWNRALIDAVAAKQ